MVDIRYVTEADLAAMIALIERRREKYEQYEPVFWKKAPDTAEKTDPFFKSLLTNERAAALVAYDDENLVGVGACNRSGLCSQSSQFPAHPFRQWAGAPWPH